MPLTLLFRPTDASEMANRWFRSVQGAARRGLTLPETPCGKGFRSRDPVADSLLRHSSANTTLAHYIQGRARGHSERNPCERMCLAPSMLQIDSDGSLRAWFKLDELFLLATLPLSPHFVIRNHREEDAAYDRPRLESLLFSISCPVPIC